MTIKKRVASVPTAVVLAFRQLKLKWKLRHFEQMYQAEKLHEQQAAHNAQWYKLNAGIIRYKLEDMKNAAKR